VPPLATRLALIFAERDRRGALEALAAIDLELSEATRPGIEHTVAHAKLTWWRGEVDRLAAGRPEHPLTRALLTAAGDAPDYRLLHERLTAADFALVGFDPTSPAEWDALLARSHGALEQLGAEALAGRRDPALAAFGAALGRGLGLLAAAESATDEARDALLARAGGALEAAAGALPAGLRAAQAPGLVRLALARTRRGRLARGRTPDPAPLLQLWIAWRAARRARLETPG
jgi:phytoene synthase